MKIPSVEQGQLTVSDFLEGGHAMHVLIDLASFDVPALLCRVLFFCCATAPPRLLVWTAIKAASGAVTRLDA